MPDLSTTIHTDMLARGKRLNLAKDSQAQIYGDHWGDPQTDPVLKWIRDNCVLPRLGPDKVVREIGPGGGRWTRYLLGARTLYVVDYYDELLSELATNFNSPVLTKIRNNGNDFPGIPDQACDFIFSFGVFVHLDFPIIEAYLANMKRIAKPNCDIVIQYADFRKGAARKIESFAKNDPETMRNAVKAAGYRILEEVNELIPHSAVIRFTPAQG